MLIYQRYNWALDHSVSFHIVQKSKQTKRNTQTSFRMCSKGAGISKLNLVAEWIGFPQTSCLYLLMYYGVLVLLVIWVIHLYTDQLVPMLPVSLTYPHNFLHLFCFLTNNSNNLLVLYSNLFTSSFPQFNPLRFARKVSN